MGVNGLTSFIFGNSSLYLRPHELSDCLVIIDGDSVAHSLAREIKGHSAFGGDYDEYYTVVKNFMLALKKCNISPIVFFDGGCQKAKFKTRFNRRHCALLKLKCYCQGFTRQQFFSLLMLDVFVNVVREMGFTYVQCDLEADGEIAAVARTLNCPVLSYDSDYFIYDVLYIPFNTITLYPVKYSHSNKYYMQCFIFNVNEFLEITGIEKPLLPILATLLGNDHIECSMFSKFFNHIRMPKIKNKSHTQLRIHGLMQWLKNENVNSAIKLILSHLKKKDAEKVSKLFNRSISHYNTDVVSQSVLNELKNKFGNVQLQRYNLNIDWPLEIAELYAKTWIPGFIINIILHQLHLTPLQVENIYKESSHFKSQNLIKKIYTILYPYLKIKNPLQLYLVVKNQYTCIEINRDSSDFINLDEVLKEPFETRLKLLYDTIGIPLNELEIVPSNSWEIFILSFKYWVKEYNNSISLAHVYAFVIMLIANQIVQTKVGYYRNSSDFMKRYGNKISELKDTELVLQKSGSFKQMLESVTLYECLLFQKNLIPLRQTTEAGSGDKYCLSTIHLFNCFQSCLFYISIINSLFSFPVPHIKVQDFYSGTLLFNLYISIKSESSVDKFGSKLFLETPNLNQIYKYLSENLSKVLGKTEVKGRKPKRKRIKKNRGSQVKVFENIHCSTDDDDDKYNDENNLYALLPRNLSVS